MKCSLSLLFVALSGLCAGGAVAAEPKLTNPSCQSAYALLGWSKFEVQKAEALEKLVVTRMQKAAVLEKMGEPCGAVASYASALKLASEGASAEHVAEARRRLAALEPGLGSTVTVKAEPPVAPTLVVTVDGVRASGPRLSLPPGNHTIVVGATGYQTATEPLSVCKEERDLIVQLTPADGAAPAVASPAAISPSVKAKEDDDKGDDDDGDDDKPAAASKVPSPTVSAPLAAPQAVSTSAVPTATLEPANAAPKPTIWKGTAALRRELARLSTAENDWQKIADHWELSKKLPWLKMGWILGRRRRLTQVDAIQPGDAKQVSFRQYKVKGQEGANAYVAHCGFGGTCNSIAKTFHFLYEGIGVPQVECGPLPAILEAPFVPEIPIPSAEEIAIRDAEWAASHAKDDDEKDEKPAAPGAAKPDADDDDDED